MIKRIPDGDLLIHAGDLSIEGSKSEIFDAFAWLSRLPHERIIFTPGNHDFGFQRAPELVDVLNSKFPRVETLVDAEAVVGGRRIWGSPWQPWFHDWAFNFLPGPAGETQAAEQWAMIPDDTAILITHGPVYGILDRTQRGGHVGCSALKARAAALSQLRLHVCGHIHESYGATKIGDVVFANACACDAQYYPGQPPIVIDLADDSARHVPWLEWSGQ